MLSGDTQQSAGGNAFQLATGALYAEKDCTDRTPRPVGGSSQQFGQFNRPEILDNLPQVLGSGAEEDDRLPGYTPDSSPQDCRADGLVEAYEKVVDFTYSRGGREELTTDIDIGIAGECLSQCTQQGGNCLAVTLLNERGGRQRCFTLASSALADQADLESSTGVTYYEKVCSRRTCSKAWSFTRVPRYEFVGVANEVARDVRSLSACRELCLGASG